MASPYFIMEVETQIIQARKELMLEVTNNNGLVERYNRDHWGTLMVNAQVLADVIKKAIEKGA